MEKAQHIFTLREAQAMLPVFTQLLRKAVQAQREAEAVTRELQELRHRIAVAGGSSVEIRHWATRRAEGELAQRTLTDAVGEISATGVQVKDLGRGLLDFPCRIEGEVVLLCWKIGEPAITHWHPLDEGFAGRRPLDSRFPDGDRWPEQ